MTNTTMLYQKYRPGRFSQLVGQSGIASSLTSALAEDRVGHAYLFSGPRGTGKTSTARILAKALNCLNPDGVEPCNQCESCVAIDEGVSLDVLEFDAASNSGVDAMREILSKVGFASPGRHKVVIVDEVHMLSTSASNAFLKTLEEPPPGVTFILATTERKKVLTTIASRCKSFEFSLVSPAELTSHLTTIVQREGITGADNLIPVAVSKGKGSVRDALSALDSLRGMDDLEEVQPAYELVNAMASKSTENIFTVIASLSAKGADMRTLAEETVALLRECFLGIMGAEDLVTETHWTERKQVAQALGARGVVSGIERIGEAITAMASGHDGRVNLEIALARWVAVLNAR